MTNSIESYLVRDFELLLSSTTVAEARQRLATRSSRYAVVVDYAGAPLTCIRQRNLEDWPDTATLDHLRAEWPVLLLLAYAEALSMDEIAQSYEVQLMEHSDMPGIVLVDSGGEPVAILPRKALLEALSDWAVPGGTRSVYGGTRSVPGLLEPPLEATRNGGEELATGADTGADTGEGAATTPSEPEARYLQGRLPERARLGEHIYLQVRIALQAGGAASSSMRPFSVPAGGLEILLVLHSPGLAPISGGSAKVRILPNTDSDWIPFELEASRTGVHTVEISAYNGSTYLGALSMQVTVDSQVATGPSIERASTMSVRRREAGEVTLRIYYDQASNVYRYTFIDDTIDVPEEKESSRLLTTPQQAVEALVQQLNQLARGRVPFTPEQTRLWLRGKGIELWNQFIPAELQSIFWERRERISRLIVVSEGDPVPWELLYPRGDGKPDAGFLAEQFPVVRWASTTPPVSRLKLSQAYFVLPDGSPPTAQSEVQALLNILGGSATANQPPISDLTGLLNLLGTSQFNLLHFACHNTFKPDSPDVSSIMMGQQPFQPTFLSALTDSLRTAAPLVFMNACRTGGEAPHYTRMGGWARSFLNAGASAFVGSLWEVRDNTAGIFAQEFYRSLLGGSNLGVAIKQARLSIQQEPGDPTWLAYTLYGDPAATIS